MRWYRGIAAGLAVVAVSVGVVLPAEVAQAAPLWGFPPGSSLNNPANVPLLTAAGVVSGGGTTAATGATGAVVVSGAAGTLGFGTTVGATVAGLGFLTLSGIESGMYVETDPDYAPESAGGSIVGMIEDEYMTATTGGYYYTITSVVVSGVSFTATAALTRYASGTANYTWNLYCRNTSTGDVSSRSVSTAPRSGSSVTFTGSCATGSVPYSAGSTTPVTMDPASTDYVHDTLAGLWYRILDAGLPRWRWVSDASPLHVVSTMGYHGTLRTTLTCSTGSTSTYLEATGRVDAEPGENLQVPPLSCPAGQIAIWAAIDYMADGTSTWVGIGSGEPSDYIKDLPVSYPDCFNTVRTCVVQLWRVTEGGLISSCGEIGQYCPNWAAESVLAPASYRCTYGSYTLDLASCSMYRNPSVGVLPNDSGETDEEGKPVPLPVNAPTPDPLPNPVTNPATGTPVETAPWIDTDGSTNSAEGRECFPTGWSILNPVEWVLKPIRCAFEPSPSKIEQTKTRLQSKWGVSVPGLLLIGISGAVGVFTDSVMGDGCNGVTLPTGWLNRAEFAGAGFPESVQLMYACPGSPLAPLATFSYWTLVGAMVVVAVRVIPAQIGKLVNYGGVSGS